MAVLSLAVNFGEYALRTFQKADSLKWWVRKWIYMTIKEAKWNSLMRGRSASAGKFRKLGRNY